LHLTYQVESQGQGLVRAPAEGWPGPKAALLGAPRMQRLQILLLIATLALMVAWLMGRATEITGQHRQYQANTVKDRVVLSTIFIGLKVIDDTRITLRLTDILAAMTSLDEILRSHCPAE